MELNTDFVFDQSKIQLSLYQMNFTNYVYLMHSGMAMGNRLPLKYWRQTDIKIDGFEMYPQNKVKVILNGLWLYVRGNKIAMRLEQKFMEHKYIQRVSPYSERKNR